jgi:hypothetical protein
MKPASQPIRPARNGVAVSKRLAPHLPALDSREEKLDTLLDHYVEAQETIYSGAGRDAADDAGVVLMPLVWNMSYRELERCLKRMRALAETAGAASPVFRSWYFHVNAWYLRAERKRAPMIRKDKKGRDYHVTTGAGPQFVLTVKREGNPGMVLMGLGWLSAEFEGEIYLPREFVEAA